jgi:His/Glu/Gln/Arg/opine family amino acid ABC transporter permease subunit
MDRFFSLIFRYREALLGGAVTSLELAVIAWLGGLALGVVLGIWRASGAKRKRRQGAIAFASMAASSIPVMVYLLWFYYPFQTVLGIRLTPFITAACVFLFYNALVIGEIIRTAAEALPPSLNMAAQVTGVPAHAYRRHVLVPLTLRAALPGYLVSQVGVLHVTLFASLISVDELFRVTQRINAIEYSSVTVFSVLALFYFALSFPVLILARFADQRLAKYGLDR